MLPIQMVDLKSQHRKLKVQINQAFTEAIEASEFIQGANVLKFEIDLAAYHTIKHCISCGNGTDALQIALMALGLKTGDEVIVPTFSFIATAEAAALLGLKITMVDVDPKTFNLDPIALNEAISNQTKLIIPVHLFGQCCNMEEILSIAKKHNLLVVEDTAQSLGAEYTFSNGHTMLSGTMGNIGITSFFPSKNLGCLGDGGALFTNDDYLAKKIKMTCNHGQEKKYYHELIGVNSRLDSIQAAVLNVKLKYLDHYIKKRQEAASFYDKAFTNHSDIIIHFRNSESYHTFHQYTIQVPADRRDGLKKHLESKNIPSMIYYPIPIHLQKAYQYLGYKKGDFPVAEKLCSTVLSLPMHTELDQEQLNYITENVLNFFKK
jgi:dTDP-4-amino-4,6-dideoxygalactose transaminase